MYHSITSIPKGTVMHGLHVPSKTVYTINEIINNRLATES